MVSYVLGKSKEEVGRIASQPWLKTASRASIDKLENLSPFRPQPMGQTTNLLLSVQHQNNSRSERDWRTIASKWRSNDRRSSLVWTSEYSISTLFDFAARSKARATQKSEEVYQFLLSDPRANLLHFPSRGPKTAWKVSRPRDSHWFSNRLRRQQVESRSQRNQEPL